METVDFSDPEMKEIFEGFLIESKELLEQFSDDLVLLETQTNDLDLLNRIFRSIHTIKGTSAFMNFTTIVTISHEAEDLLNKLRKEELKANEDIISTLLEVHDWINVLIDKIVQGEDTNVDFSETINTLKELNGSEIEESENTSDFKVDASDSKQSAFDEVLSKTEDFKSPGDFTDEEEDLIQKAFAEMNSNFANDNKKQETSQNDDIKAETPKDEVKIPENKTNNKPKKVVAETIRIDINRIEMLMDLSGELVLGRNRLAQISEQINKEPDNLELFRELQETTDQVDTITSDIQAAVMRMRMVPIAKLFQKAPRIIRDLSKEFKKKINLVIKGEETEIDRGIIEELNDPLVHMIRNSCDHGIEAEDDRILANKPEKGTITLDADQEGNNIVLKISDDGKGMNPEFLKNSAISKGILTPEQAENMPDREAYQLIFAPGFSTAAKVSSVSGRGVGMDVVRTNIVKLKGQIDIQSELGVGTTFIIKLPLTLAIIQGLLVSVSRETYALPLSSVIEVVSIDKESLFMIDQKQVIRIRDEVYPLISLHEVLDCNGESDSDIENKNIVLVGLGNKKVGLVVDSLLGQQEIVIKSLGEYLGKLKNIAGSTILGDGKVIMILDIAELMNENFELNVSNLS